MLGTRTRGEWAGGGGARRNTLSQHHTHTPPLVRFFTLDPFRWVIQPASHPPRSVMCDDPDACNPT